MNILHLNTNYEMSTIYSNMLYELNKIKNIDGRLYYPVYENKIIEDKNKGNVDTSKILNKNDKFFFFRRNKKLYKDVTRIYSLNRFDAIIAYSLFSNGYLAYTIKRKHNVPYIVIVQNTDINMYFKKMIHLRKIGRKILNDAQKIIFISKPYKELLLKKYIKNVDKEIINSKSEVIPFGIDNYWFENLNMPKKLQNKDQLRLIYVGKINNNKNLKTSLKVCEKLIELGYSVTFTIVGEIVNSRLGNLIKNKNYVNYIPFVTQEELIKIYRKNDIFIMPSIHETFGLVYAEAMSQGLPIIYTKNQGFDKHFEEGNVGYSVDCFDVNDITKKIILICNNYSSLSTNCINLVKKFKWENISSYYRLLLKDVYLNK